MKTIDAVVAAALLVSSIAAAAPKPKLPKRWIGTAQYTYTYNGDGRSVQQSASASVVLVPVRSWINTYQVSRRTIKWEYTEKTESDGCTLTSSGSYPATKYHLVLQLQLPRPRASFSGQGSGASTPSPATMTCPDGTSQTSMTGGADVFFMLTRNSAGFPVKAGLTKIAGSLRTAQSAAVSTLRFSFVGKR